MQDGGCDDPRNCLDDAGARAAAEAVNDAGYAVFVIGIPGSEDYTGVLEDLAEAGGTGSYYQADDTDELAQALSDIVTRVATCRFDLSIIPVEPSIGVTINGDDIPQSQVNGWDIVDADTIELFGSACNLALVSGVQVEVDYCYGAEG